MTSIKVEIDASRMDTRERRLKCVRVAVEMEKVLNSPEFKANLLSMPDHSGELSSYRNLTKEQLYDFLMAGAERLNPKNDNTLNLAVDDYYTFKGVIGYTYQDTHIIYSNTKFFDSNDLTRENHHMKMTGSNFIHEWGHKLGFDHDFNSTPRRPQSICYQLNEVYEKTWDEVILPTLQKYPKIIYYRRWFKTYSKTIFIYY